MLTDTYTALHAVISNNRLKITISNVAIAFDHLAMCTPSKYAAVTSTKNINNVAATFKDTNTIPIETNFFIIKISI